LDDIHNAPQIAHVVHFSISHARQESFAEYRKLTGEHKMKHVFLSEKLNKYFESELDCVKAEKELEEAEAKKRELANAKKAEAAKVEDAFKKLNAAKKNLNEVAEAAGKAYVAAVREAKKIYDAAFANANKSKEEAEAEFNKQLEIFNKAHPEGFHLTLRDGDVVKTYSTTSRVDAFEELKSLEDKLWKMLLG